MAYREWQPWKNWQKRCSDRMNLYALKSDEGYLKIAENETCTLVGINKDSVYPEAALEKLKVLKETFESQVSNLRIVEMTLVEKDYFA